MLIRYFVYFVIIVTILISIYLFTLRRLYLRLTSDNWLHTAYELFNDNVFPFKKHISSNERTYIDNIITDFDHEYEFKNGYKISPYSFSISIDVEKGGIVNATRVNIGSVEKNIRQHVKALLDHINLPDSLCETGFKYYGIGWDLLDKILKVYTLKEDRSEIQCYVFRVKRDKLNNIISTAFDTKKAYAVGNRKTIMRKKGMSIDQINSPRFCTRDMRNETANEWVKKMQRLGFILDTWSQYDGKINLYFD